MQQFYMHIGLPRCASTMIEMEFLMPGQAGNGRLSTSGITPLRDLHDALRTAAEEPQWTEDFILRVRDQCIDNHTGGDNRAFFSSDEALTLTYSEEGLNPDMTHRAGCWARLMNGFDPVLIMIVRNQVAYIESLYGLHLQHAGTKEFPEFANSLPMGAMDWAAVARTWADVFGTDKLVVLPLEKSAYDHPDQPHGDFLEAFQAVMGVDNPLGLGEARVFNPSLPRVLMPVQQQINQAIDGESAIRVADIIRSSVTPQAVVKASLFGRDQAQAVRAMFQASNEHLFHHYMPGFNPVDYLPA